jgi:chromosomal replication initiator protein
VADRSLLDSSGPVTAPAVSGGAYGSASVASSTFSLNPDQTFETFVVGSSNQFAHAGAMAVAEKPARTYNPLFLFGMVGLGKTHLLNAIGNRILRDNPSARIVYLSSEQFVNELINSIRDERMNEFRNKYRDNCDALLVDDIQFLAGKIRTQEEFFYTFNALHTSGKQIVVTSDKFPREIQGMEERLRNRFEWGLIADIQPPDLETKAAILKKKAAREHTILPDDVAMFIATHTNSNIRELEGILIRLNAAASVYQKPIDLQFTQFALRDVLKSAKPALTIDGILETVSKFYDTRVNDMKSQKKHKQLVWPRQVAMYLCRRHTSGSFPEIGQKFGGRDHTTVIHAVKKIEESLSRDPEVSTQIKELERLLGF